MSMDVSLLRQFSSETFSSLLRQIPGDKDLIIEAPLMKSLDKICGMSLLKSCGVKRVFKLDQDVKSNCANVVYFVWASLNVATNVIHLTKSNPHQGVTTYAIFVPNALQSIYRLIEQEGMADKILIKEFMWQLIPLDSDLMSLEMANLFQSLVCKGNLSFLSCLSKTLLSLESLYGLIPNKIAIGKKSSAIINQLEILESSNLGGQRNERNDPEIGHLIIIDREYDWTSCLLSPVTYEALLDEVFGIQGGTIDFSQFFKSINMKSPSDEKLATIKLELSTRDKIFENIRYKHFASIFAYLSNNAKQIRQSQSMASSMNVTEMKDFVQTNLKSLQQQSKSISIHISASEIIQSEKGFYYESILPLEHDLVKGNGTKETVDYLEKIMSQKYPFEVALRLLCLASVTQNGLFLADYSRMKKLVLEAYGYKHLVTLCTLEEIGLLKCKNHQKKDFVSLPPFSQLAAKLDLIPKSNSDALDRNPASVFNGIYVPLVCRIAQTLVESPQNLNELLKSNVLPHCSSILSNLKGTSKKNVFVFFVGGYTLAESASLKAVQANTGYRFLISGTNNMTGKSVINEIVNL